MADLEALKAKYPGMNHAPREGCKFCGGTGEKPNSLRPDEKMCCICIFVDHDFADEAASMIGNFAKRELKKMRDEQ